MCITIVTISYISLSILGASESDKESILSENPPCEVKRDQVFYDLTFDSINQKVKVRHPVRGEKKSFKHGANICNIGKSRKERAIQCKAIIRHNQEHQNGGDATL